MMLNATMRRKDSEVETEACRVEKVITLSDDDYHFFTRNMLEDYDFLRKNRDMMGYSDDGIRHCLLVTSEHGDDGILVDAQGSSYARYSAHVPHARQLLERDRYASLDTENCVDDEAEWLGQQSGMDVST